LRRIPRRYKVKLLKEGFKGKMLSLLAKLSKRWIKLNKEGIANHLHYFIFENK
jgi:RNA:NAD 2'-phosphotransferase (TPT1/KptA family)